ncbi:MAG: DUF3313 family protein [Deltaproteobacteria bacterium]|jgi:hypothetical protein|nr:DUF3313 family protein [Deltaproteobacteria bacterium]MBW2498465.1 DUF3313 family protein [Deltaproteobacteria bacterium]
MRRATLFSITLAGLTLLGSACSTSSPPSSEQMAAPASAAQPSGEATAGGSAPALPENFMPEDRIPTGEDAERSPDGLVRVEAPESRGLIYVKSPRPHLQRYKRMILAPTEISYRKGGPQFGSLDHDILAKRFRADLIAAINAGPAWERTDRPAEDVLLVRVAIIDVDVQPDLGGSGSSITYATAAGGAIVAFELAESQTGQPLYRYIERRILPAGVYSGSRVDRQRLAELFGQFARHVGAQLREHYAVIREIERIEQEGASAPASAD